MRCTNAEFLANAGALMTKADAAEEALEIVGEDGEVRAVVSCPALRSNVIGKARPKDGVVSFFRYRPDKPLPKDWDGLELTAVKPGSYIVWAKGFTWEAMTEKEFDKKYVILDDWDT